MGTGDGSRVAAKRWAGGRGGRGPLSLLCPALLWVQMIESECFKDINEGENEPVVVLEPNEKTDQQVPLQPIYSKEITNLKSYLYPLILCSIIYNNQVRE